MEYHSAEESRQAHIAYHLVPESVWCKQSGRPSYVPEAFETDGFIHCTNGLSSLQHVGNMFYSNDMRDYLVLVIDTRQVAPEVRYDDPEHTYPHIHGVLNTDAVTGTLIVKRDQDGTFAAFRAI